MFSYLFYTPAQVTTHKLPINVVVCVGFSTPPMISIDIQNTHTRVLADSGHTSSYRMLPVTERWLHKCACPQHARCTLCIIKNNCTCVLGCTDIHTHAHALCVVCVCVCLRSLWQRRCVLSVHARLPSEIDANCQFGRWPCRRFGRRAFDTRIHHAQEKININKSYACVCRRVRFCAVPPVPPWCAILYYDI